MAHVSTRELFQGGTMGKSLTEMLRERIGGEPECDAEAEAIELELVAIKEVFKEWLGKVGLAYQLSEESTRQLLITLVDEP